MELGAFSSSLAVKDLLVSKAFYEKLGFVQSGGNMEHNYVVMRNGTTLIGLYQGMFEKNILTFNPGWDFDCSELAEFADVRDIEKSLEGDGVKLSTKTEAGSKGPASITLTDPDGNEILIDQHR
ncbi:MAG: VOC family protein [Alphaproteobacteria bacterium]|nr:VOC family protein [Alphaproteobacteria bacterium]